MMNEQFFKALKKNLTRVSQNAITPMELKKSIKSYKNAYNLCDENGRSALYHIILDKKIDCAKIIIEDHPQNSPLLKNTDMDGRTLLYLAAKEGLTALIQPLIDKGVDINAQKSKGYTALYIAAQKGHLDAVKVLLKNKVKVDKPSDRLSTPLHIAVQEGHIKVVKALLDANADPNSDNIDNFSPLTIAKMEEDFSSLSVLYDAIEERSFLNRYGYSYKYFIDELNAKLVNQRPDDEIIKYLLAHLDYPRKRDGSAITPLHIVLKHKRFTVGDGFCKAGDDKSQTTVDAHTPLLAAASDGELEADLNKEKIKDGVSIRQRFFNTSKEEKSDSDKKSPYIKRGWT